MNNKKTTVLRIFLIALCVLWMGVIFFLSAENSDESGGRSGDISFQIVETFTKNDTDMTDAERQEIADDLDPPLRTMAHMFCFCVLGMLYFLTSRTFPASTLIGALSSVGCALIYAISDEVHQHFVPGRSMQLQDILVDLTGAVIGVAFVLIVMRIRKRRKAHE